MKARALILLGLLSFSQFVVLAHASGGSKVTTFHYGDFGPKLFDIDVHFSWDNDVWKIKENHEVGFSLEVTTINPNVVNLTLGVREIAVYLKSDKFDGVVKIHSEDVSNQITELIWRWESDTILNNVRSFSFDVQAPEPTMPLTEDTSVEIYYLIALGGNYVYKDANSQAEGSGQIGGSWLSNEGNIHGGIEDPVWITVKSEPSFPWLYVAVAAVLVGFGIIGVSAFFLVRHRKAKIARD